MVSEFHHHAVNGHNHHKYSHHGKLVLRYFQRWKIRLLNFHHALYNTETIFSLYNRFKRIFVPISRFHFGKLIIIGFWPDVYEHQFGWFDCVVWSLDQMFLHDVKLFAKKTSSIFIVSLLCTVYILKMIWRKILLQIECENIKSLLMSIEHLTSERQ